MRFRAALPHELDGPGPNKADLPVYVERVEELETEIQRMTQTMWRIEAARAHAEAEVVRLRKRLEAKGQ